MWVHTVRVRVRRQGHWGILSSMTEQRSSQFVDMFLTVVFNGPLVIFPVSIVFVGAAGRKTIAATHF